MKITVQHRLAVAEARRRVETIIQNELKRFGPALSEFNQRWEDDTLHFDFKAAGMKGSGEVEVTALNATIDMRLPLLALPMEPKIREMLRTEAERALA